MKSGASSVSRPASGSRLATIGSRYGSGGDSRLVEARCALRRSLADAARTYSTHAHSALTRPGAHATNPVERWSSSGLRAARSHEVRRFQRIETSERAAPGNHRVSIRFWRRLSVRGSLLRAAKIAGRRRQNLLDPRTQRTHKTWRSCNESSERWSSSGLRAVKSHEVMGFQRIETSERAAPGNHQVSIRFWRRLSARESPLRAAKIAGRRRQNLLDPRTQRTHKT